jgi:hypothetical protein
MSDSEDSLLDSAYEKLIDSSSSTVGADLKKKKAPAVVKWPSITHIKVMPDGKKIVTHPFLSDCSALVIQISYLKSNANLNLNV